MKPTLVSIKNNLPLSPSLAGASISFPTLNDFSPHNEPYLGMVPMLYSYDPQIANNHEWVEIKDGFFTLISFLLNKKHQKIILPYEAGLFLSDFYYSTFDYKNKEAQNDYCYIHLDYYQEYSGHDHLKKCMTRILELQEKYNKLKLAFSLHARASSRTPHCDFFNFIRTLPKSCEIIPAKDLFEISNFKQRSVYLLTDEDFVLKSPWENILAARGAIINGVTAMPQDKEIMRLPISPYVDKVIFHKIETNQSFNKQIKDYFETILQMIQSTHDFLNPDYLRHVRDTVKLTRK